MEIISPVFNPGDEVDVRSSSTGVWHPAHVHSRHGANQYWIVYTSLPNTADPSRLLHRANASDLRSPLSRNPTTPTFHPTDDVEVESTLSGFAGGWYEARVDSPAPIGHYIVTYNLLRDGDQPLRETVPRSRLRHRPDKQRGCGFAIGEAVEVLYKMGWWEGIVCEKPGWEERQEYKVFVLKDRKSVVCTPEVMRRRVRWVDGAWEGLQPQGEKECGTGKRKNGHMPHTSEQKRRIIDMKGTSHGDLVVDHQDSMLVNKPSVEGHSAPNTTELTTPVDTNLMSCSVNCQTELMREFPNMMSDISSSKLPGTVKSQYQHDVASTVDIGADLVAPLSNGSHSKETALPFKKRSPVWKYIDLEVTPKRRQHPHFRPLKQFPEVQREGIAIGLMATYELMSHQGGLKMDHSCHNLDEYISKTIELEANGFEVQNMRARFEKLQRVKNNHAQLLQKKYAIEGQAFKTKEKSSHLNAELEAADKAAMALDLVLRFFRKRSFSLLKLTEESETTKAMLQGDLSFAENELVSTERTLQNLLNAL